MNNLELIIVYFDSVAKHLESANSMFSFLWWIVGFYWVTADGQSLTSNSPQLYWFVPNSNKLSFKVVSVQVFVSISMSFLLLLTYVSFCRLCITFLAIDVVVIMICVVVACLVGIAVCCCLPCIIAILYVVTDQVVNYGESFTVC